MLKITVEFKINNCKDRENMLVALANANYPVTVERRQKDDLIDTGNYFIIVDLKQRAK